MVVGAIGVMVVVIGRRVDVVVEVIVVGSTARDIMVAAAMENVSVETEAAVVVVVDTAVVASIKPVATMVIAVTESVGAMTMAIVGSV